MSYKQIIASLFHVSAPVGHKEKIISAVSAFVGILLTGILSASLGHSAMPLMIASMGASSVLLFAAPHSPMAQPWSFVGGHLLSALIGITCFKFIPSPFVAAALAVALSSFVMHWLHCLHPPGGATALAMVLSGQEMHVLGYGALLSPVGLNVLVLMIIALSVNNLFPGRRYPMLSPVAVEKAAPPKALTFGRAVLTKEDIETALKDMNTYIDVTEEDLEQIYARASLHHMRQRMGEVTCRDIMTRDVVTAERNDKIETVWETMRQRKVKGMPVVDRVQRVVGIVTIMDFLKREDRAQPPAAGVLGRLKSLLHRVRRPGAGRAGLVEEIMSAPAMTAREDTHIVSLIPLFSEHNIHHVPIVDREGRITGMVTQTDLSVAMYRYWAAMP